MRLLACAALALPAGALGQGFALAPVPVRLAGPPGAAWDRATVLAPVLAPPRTDVVTVLVGALPGTSAGAVFEGGALAAAPFPYPVATSPVWFTAGTLNESPRAAGLWSELGSGRLYLGSGPAAPPWGLYTSVFGPGGEPLQAAIFAHLVATPRNVLVVAGTASLQALDFAGAAAPAASPLWTSARSGTTTRLRPLRLGPAARAGFEDVAWSRQGSTSLFLLWLDAAGAASVDAAGLAEVVEVDLAPLVPDGGGAALDTDGDGTPDLVVSAGAGPATLLAIHNDDVPSHLAGAARTSLDARLGLVDPRFLASLELDGAPAIGVYDADPAAPEVVVASADGAGGFRVWRTPVPLVPGSPSVRDAVAQLWAGDVAGGPAADLVVAYASGAVEVFEGDAAPSLAWAPGSPPDVLARGVVASVEVLASDPDGAVARVELLAAGAPVASAVAPPYRLPIPADLLCTAGSPLALVARATDELGVAREIAAAVPLLDAPPALALTAAPATLVLAPGGARLAVDAAASASCGRPVSVEWSAAALPAGAVATSEAAPSGGRLAVTLAEAAYPGLLDGAAASATVSATARDGAGLASAPASLAVPLDASGLVAVAQRSDRAALAEGEVAVLTTTLTSRLAVALRRVRVHLDLDGLAAAGPVTARGARVLADGPAPGGHDVVLELVPGGGMPLEVELPVRRLGAGRGGAASAQALAVGSGLALSPAVAGAGAARLPGCGCGADAGGASALAGLALLLLAPRRRRGRR